MNSQVDGYQDTTKTPLSNNGGCCDDRMATVIPTITITYKITKKGSTSCMDTVWMRDRIVVVGLSQYRNNTASWIVD